MNLITPPKTLLLATDRSARCDRALDRAIQLARQWNARLIVLTVVEPGWLTTERVRATPLPSWATQHDDPVQRTFLKLRRDANADDVQIEPRAVEGAKVGETVLKVAKDEGADFIITGVARNEAFGRTILGTTVDYLARHARVPVLVVRERVRQAYGNIVASTDFSPSSGQALCTAAVLFPQARRTLFHAFEVAFLGLMDARQQAAIAQGKANAQAEADKFIAALPTCAGTGVVIEHGDVVRLLFEFVRDHDADLIALGTHGRSALFDILIGSVAQRILETAATDVLLVRDRHAAS